MHARTDVIDFLVRQHELLRQLCADITQKEGAEKKQQFNELIQLMYVHERGEQAVIHPAVRDHTTVDGQFIGIDSIAEEEKTIRDLAELQHLGVDHVSFDTRFAIFHQGVLDHTAREERDEFPLLRQYLGPHRLHQMASELHDVQIMC